MSMIFGVIAELPDVIDMRTFKKKKAMKNSPLQFYKSKKNGRWYWKITAKNGQKVANCSGGKESGYLTLALTKKGFLSTKKLIQGLQP